MKQWKLLNKSPTKVVVYKGSTQLTWDIHANTVTEHYLHDNGDEIELGTVDMTDELKQLFADAEVVSGLVFASARERKYCKRIK